MVGSADWRLCVIDLKLVFCLSVTPMGHEPTLAPSPAKSNPRPAVDFLPSCQVSNVTGTRHPLNLLHRTLYCVRLTYLLLWKTYGIAMAMLLYTTASTRSCHVNSTEVYMLSS